MRLALNFQLITFFALLAFARGDDADAEAETYNDAVDEDEEEDMHASFQNGDELSDDEDAFDEETSVAEMLQAADADGDGKLSFREFILVEGDEADPSTSSLLEGETESELTEEDKNMLQDQFNKADTNGDGFIDKQEMSGLLQVLEDEGS